jgi:hypothetical protein
VVSIVTRIGDTFSPDILRINPDSPGLLPLPSKTNCASLSDFSPIQSLVSINNKLERVVIYFSDVSVLESPVSLSYISRSEYKLFIVF